MNKLFRSVWSDLKSPTTVGAVVAASMLTSVAGPFGTYAAASFGERLLYWPGVVCATTFLAFLISGISDNQFGKRSIAIQAFAIGGAMALIAVPLIASYTSLFFQIEIADFPWVETALVVFLVSFLAVILRKNYFVRIEARNDQVGTRRIELSAGEFVKHVAVDDHYVDVWSTDSHQRILMRFQDALGELSAQDGMQVHRSHWVGRMAVAESQKKNGQLSLILTCGTEVPVSRKYEAKANEFFDLPY